MNDQVVATGEEKEENIHEGNVTKGRVMPAIDLLGFDYTDNQVHMPNDAHWLQHDDEGNPIVHRHDDIIELLKDKRLMRSPMGEDYADSLEKVFPNLHWMFTFSPSENSEIGDPKAHRQSRQFFNLAFSKTSLEGWYREIETVGEEFAKRLFENKGVVNLYEELRTYPFTVSTKIFGIDMTEQQIKDFQHAAMIFLSSYGLIYSQKVDKDYIVKTAVAAEESISWARELFANWFSNAEKLAETNPSIKNFVDAYNASEFNDDQKLAALVSILAASADTTATTSCLFIRSLLRHPEKIGELKAAIANGDEALLDRATWELIRYDGASSGILRFPKEDIAYKDTVFKKDQMVFLANMMADSDGTFYPNPRVLDFNRENSDKLLDFGFGVRTCPGKFLAHKELKEFLRGVIRYIPEGTTLVDQGKTTYETRHYIVRFIKDCSIEIPG